MVINRNHFQGKRVMTKVTKHFVLIKQGIVELIF
jgi:hypothetical protein